MTASLIPDEVVEALEGALDHYGIPGASLTVGREGDLQTVVRGYANRKASWPVTPDTLFQLGSVAKIHTALLVLRLVERGDLTLATPVIDCLPEWGSPRDPMLSDVTIQHLLSHTSGLQSQHFEHYGRGHDAISHLCAAVQDDVMVHPPGRHFSYSNTGYAVAGRVVEVVTGLAWHEAIRRLVGEPLQLQTTSTLPEEVLLHPAAVGSRKNESGSVVDVERWYGSHALAPSGAVSCTSRELVTLALEASQPGGSDLLGLGPQMAEQMLSPQIQVLTPGTRAWGLGWTLFETEDETELVGHNGDTPGQTAALRVVPQQRLAVGLLFNSQVPNMAAEPVIHHLLEVVAGVSAVSRSQPYTPPVESGSAAVMERMVGRYGQDKFQVDVEMTDSESTDLSLSIHRWGSSVADWFGRSETTVRATAEVVSPTQLVSDGAPWWFVPAEPNQPYAFITNGHQIFPRQGSTQ